MINRLIICSIIFFSCSTKSVKQEIPNPDSQNIYLKSYIFYSSSENNHTLDINFMIKKNKFVFVKDDNLFNAKVNISLRIMNLKSGDMITFIISLGNPPNYYVTPNLINQNLYKAKENISKAGLLLGKITYEYNNDYLNNTVLEQSKTAGMRLSFPTKIDLIVTTDTK